MLPIRTSAPGPGAEGWGSWLPALRAASVGSQQDLRAAARLWGKEGVMHSVTARVWFKCPRLWDVSAELLEAD